MPDDEVSQSEPIGTPSAKARKPAKRKRAKRSGKKKNSEATGKRVQRRYPASSFEDALPLANAFQKHAQGEKARRLTLLKLMERILVVLRVN